MGQMDDGREDDGLPVAQAGDSGAYRVRGAGGGWAFEALAVHPIDGRPCAVRLGLQSQLLFLVAGA